VTGEIKMMTRRPDVTMSYAEILEACNFEFDVATDLDYYGPEATEADVEEYADFAESLLDGMVEEKVTINRVEHYGFRSSPDEMRLREYVWQKFLNQ
jgi:hypothetical protein